MNARCLTGLWLVLAWAGSRGGMAVEPSLRQFVHDYCVSCHADSTGEQLNLDTLTQHELTTYASQWEKVVRKLAARQMPPLDQPQPDDQLRLKVIQSLSASLDANYAQQPHIPATEPLRRLTRTEYQNSVRDLLGIEIDASALLPQDESSHGFDNITVNQLNATYVNRAIIAAEKISHLAIGADKLQPQGETIRVRPDITQDEHIPGLPIGTRGGTLVKFHAARNGKYKISVRLARDRNEEVEGLSEPHVLEVMLDRYRVTVLTIEPPGSDRDFSKVDAHLSTEVAMSAGPHAIGIAFIKKSSSLLETKRQPYHAHYNMHRHPRLGPAVYEVSIVGPVDPVSEAVTQGIVAQRDDPKSKPAIRRDLQPGQDPVDCARAVLEPIVRRAYRRPINGDDLVKPLSIFEKNLGEGYQAALERALAAVLVSPHFLLKVEATPQDVQPGTVYPLGDYEIATRLSYFLWSSLPDDELLQLAAERQLGNPEVLRQQVRRMVRDGRSQNLVDNFAEQWLYLRNLASITPDLRLFPDFDDNLRQAFMQESKLCFADVLRNDRSVLELVQSPVTYLNERLARHYGIPKIYGSRFRRVDLTQLADDEGQALSVQEQRGGLLRQASIQTITSYATRTSPVLRGHWVLKNLVGSPPPPPPANVPALKDNTVSANLTVRQRLAEHRQHAACAGCHNLLDPVGFAMEHYDAIGRWRELEEGIAVDDTASLNGSPAFSGVSGLEKELLKTPELFVGALAEKLLTFAVGRGMEPTDAPAIRTVVRQAAQDGYRFSRLIEEVVLSPPFRMRLSP